MLIKDLYQIFPTIPHTAFRVIYVRSEVYINITKSNSEHYYIHYLSDEELTCTIDLSKTYTQDQIDILLQVGLHFDLDSRPYFETTISTLKQDFASFYQILQQS